MSDRLKSLVFSVIKLLPVWTILGWIVDYLEGLAKKTENKIDDIVVEALRAVIGIFEDNKDTIFNGEEAKKPIQKQ